MAKADETISAGEIKARQLDKEIEALLKGRGWTKRGDTWKKEWPEESE